MTTVIEDLQALLQPIAAGGSWYGANTATPPTFPYIVFMRVVSVANVALGGPSNEQNTRIQVDIYSLRVSEVVALEQAVELAFGNWSTQNVPLSSQDFFESDVRCWRVSKDYSIWGTN